VLIAHPCDLKGLLTRISGLLDKKSEVQIFLSSHPLSPPYLSTPPHLLPPPSASTLNPPPTDPSRPHPAGTEVHRTQARPRRPTSSHHRRPLPTPLLPSTITATRPHLRSSLWSPRPTLAPTTSLHRLTGGALATTPRCQLRWVSLPPPALPLLSAVSRARGNPRTPKTEPEPEP
jgi:hypothetical protein